MRISSGIIAAALLVLLLAATAVEARSGGDAKATQAAFERGLAAYKVGNYELAIPALEDVATKGADGNKFFAEFYLARIYSDTSGTQADHAKAYVLFQKLADENVDADPDEGQRAPFVAKALTALAGYLNSGVPELGLKPDVERAVEYLQNAATSFGDKDAQFELAKIYLRGEGAEDIKRGKHFMSTLAKEGYPSAQAYLADMYWNGRSVKKDEQRALALITVAAENAPPQDRIWIEDVFLSMYCGSSQGLRKQADGIVDRLRQAFSHSASAGEGSKDAGEAQPLRTCRSGEVVEIKRPTTTGSINARPLGDAMQGSSGIGLRDVGVSK